MGLQYSAGRSICDMPKSFERDAAAFEAMHKRLAFHCNANEKSSICL